MKKQALLIGINNYSRTGSLNNLNFARQDAEEVSDALRACYGFTEDEITLMTCGQEGALSPSTPESILNQLQSEQFKEPLDLFIFGFWGHGIWEDNVRYLCPMSTLQNKLSKTCLPLDEIIQSIAELPIHNACLILDCCQNIAGRGVQYMQEEEKNYLENKARDIVFNSKKTQTQNGNIQVPQNNGFDRKVAILNSCRPGEIAYEWDEKKHGIFTAHLLEAMRKRLGTVTDWAMHLNNHVSKTAAKLGKSAQTPFYSLEGCIELPAAPNSDVELSGPSVTVLERVSSEASLKQAALKLIELFQESSKLYESEKVHSWFLRQKEEALSIFTAIDNRSISGQAAYSRLLDFARNAGNWVNTNLSGKKLPYASYLWYSWKKFANENQLDEITRALNP